jgi:putative ABC transport system substrate-binding protein
MPERSMLRRSVILLASQLTLGLAPVLAQTGQVTSTIPIVMVSAGDPVGSGMVPSLAQPGGNITGTSGLGPELAGKNLVYIRELKPKAKRVAVLANATDPFTKPFLGGLESAGAAMGIAIRPTLVREAHEFDAAFAAWASERVDAVAVQPSLPPRRAIDLALNHRLSSFSFVRSSVPDRALMAYASNAADIHRRTASYVDKVLKGARPADLHVQQPTKFDLVINARSARALGLTIPGTLMLRASEVNA